jgi:hypothetical protein
MRVLIVEDERSTHRGAGPSGGTTEQHVAVAPVRALVDPVAMHKEVVDVVAGSDVQAVVLFGSIA